MRLLTLLPLLSLLPSRAASSWAPLGCPVAGSPFPSSCTQPALGGAAGAAVTLFFQIESTGTGGAAFSCVDTAAASLVYCARSWTQPESGAAGSCFFLLPPGAAFRCAASGGAVNVIDASFAALAPGVLAPGAAAAAPACPGGVLSAASSPSCTAPAGDADAWVLASWVGVDGAGSGGAFTCVAGGVTVCAWAAAASGTQDGGSCAFLQPAGSSLTCTATRGAVRFAPAAALPLAAAVAGGAPPGGAPCPPAAAAPNDCDCTAAAAAGADALVALAAGSVDANFNAFHCSVEGVNVCGWGSNTGMNGSAGGCFFAVPAGASYACQMEWGAAAFSSSAMLGTRTALFAASAGSLPPRLARGVHGAAASPRSAHALDALFAAWRAEHGVAYASPAAAAAGRAAFAEHVAAADAAAAHMSDRAPAERDAAGRPTRFNRFADMPRAAWEAAYRGRAARSASRASAPPPPLLPPPPPAPAAVDWRAAGVVTAVKDQGQCGSCWSFSTTGAVESAAAIAAGGAPVSLSEQQLVSCSNTSDGCDGGYPTLAIEWLAAHGADTEASWPYASGGGAAPPCTPAGPPPRVRAPVNVTGWRLVPGNTSAAVEAALADWLAAYGPVSILVDAMTQLWWPYTGGIMRGCCDVSVDHAVLLVGLNVSAAGDAFWIIKNSWGASWGEGGYLRLARGGNECGIASEPVLPCVAGGALPPPPPPPPPRPTWQCPPDAAAVNASANASCVWSNASGTAAGTWRMPPSSVAAYCDYLAQGYMGWTFDAHAFAQADYPCPPSFTAGGDGGAAWFCTLEAGQAGFTGWPAGAVADCASVADGLIGYSWPAASS